MKINMHILEADLSDLGIEARITSGLYDRMLSFASSTDGTCLPKSSVVYVIEASNLKTLLANADKNVHVLCAGQPDESLLKNNHHDVMWTNKAITTSSLLERVCERFALYNEWLDSIHMVMAKGKPLRKVGDLSEPMFKNPLWMWDSQLQTIFHAAELSKKVFPKGYLLHTDGDPWPIDEVNAIDDTFRSLMEKREPYLLPALFGYRSLGYNLFTDGKYTATISVDEIDARLTKRDFVLLKVLGDVVGMGLMYQPNFSKHALFQLGSQVADLLDRGSVAPSRLNHSLAKKHWSNDDVYRVVVASKHSDVEYPELLLGPIAETVCSKVPCTMFAHSRGDLVFITNLSMNDSPSIEYPNRIAAILKSGRVRMNVGASIPFNNFANLPFFRSQANDAIRFGERNHASGDVMYSDDYLLDSIVYRLKRDSVPETLFPPCILLLSEYDRRYETELMDTLDEYLKNNLSTNKTAQALYIHRNTLLGRIKKIEDVGGIDLNDKNTRLLLRIAFVMRELHGAGGGAIE